MAWRPLLDNPATATLLRSYSPRLRQRGCVCFVQRGASTNFPFLYAVRAVRELTDTTGVRHVSGYGKTQAAHCSSGPAVCSDCIFLSSCEYEEVTLPDTVKSGRCPVGQSFMWGPGLTRCSVRHKCSCKNLKSKKVHNPCWLCNLLNCFYGIVKQKSVVSRVFNWIRSDLWTKFGSSFKRLLPSKIQVGAFFVVESMFSWKLIPRGKRQHVHIII